VVAIQTTTPHISSEHLVRNCRRSSRLRNRRTSSTTRRDHARAGNPAASRNLVQLPQKRATVPGATPVSRQNRTSVTRGPNRPANSRSSTTKSSAADMGEFPHQVSPNPKPRRQRPRITSSLSPYGRILRGFLGGERRGVSPPCLRSTFETRLGGPDVALDVWVYERSSTRGDGDIPLVNPDAQSSVWATRPTYDVTIELQHSPNATDGDVSDYVNDTAENVSFSLLLVALQNGVH